MGKSMGGSTPPGRHIEAAHGRAFGGLEASRPREGRSEGEEREKSV